MITLQQAKQLKYRQEIFSTTHKDSRGWPKTWRVNGAVKTWKRSPERVQVPVKHGQYDFGYLTEHDLDNFCLDENEARGASKLCVHVASQDDQGKVIKAIKKLDKLAYIDTEHNPVTFWVVTTVSVNEVSNMAGVVDCILASK